MLPVPQPTDRIVKRLFTVDAMNFTSIENQISEVYLEASVSENASRGTKFNTCMHTLTSFVSQFGYFKQ